MGFHKVEEFSIPIDDCGRFQIVLVSVFPNIYHVILGNFIATVDCFTEGKVRVIDNYPERSVYWFNDLTDALQGSWYLASDQEWKCEGIPGFSCEPYWEDSGEVF